MNGLSDKKMNFSQIVIFLFTKMGFCDKIKVDDANIQQRILYILAAKEVLQMAATQVKVLTETVFDETVLQADKPVLVDFWAPWCGPCRMVSPLIDQLAEEYEGKALVGKVNVDDEGALALRYNVMTIPTVMVFKDGKIVSQVTGAYPKSHFEDMLNSALA